jgi:hypothetical protein
VNNLQIKTIEFYADKIYNRIIEIIEKTEPNYQLIHGDIHLGNILEKQDTPEKKLYFIDPRGVFGNTKLFGLKEYDYAKLLFGISGYSIFDTMEIDQLKIQENNNIEIDFIKNHEYIFDETIFDELTTLLCLSIWLGNNSCFIDPNKKIMSLMIAFYYCEKIL